MKNAVFVITLLVIIPTIGSAQTQSRQRLAPDSTAQNEPNTRSRVVGPKVANHADSTKSRPTANSEARPTSRTEAKATEFTWGNTPIVGNAPPAAQLKPTTNAASVVAQPLARTVVQPTILKVNEPPITSRVVSSPVSPTSPALYVVGAGDVLDIRLSNTPSRESTLFTVLKNGAIEYPLLDRPLVVVGLTTDDIARTLTARIKVIKTPRVSVNVREYASHTVIVSGLVDNPGTKIIRRQAMPLFALVAEASVRPEATTVTIVRNGKEGDPISLKDETAMATLVSSGDAIRISGGSSASSQYVYVGGDVVAPGEKTFRSGMTVTQMLLSAGASVSTTKTVRVARRNASGLLSTTEYDVAAIAHGKVPDPQLAPGDRIEVKRSK